jgi:hypothetical protein
VCGLREGGQWAKPGDFTPRLSGVIKLARLMVVRQAYEARRQSIARKVQRGMSQVHAKEESLSHVQLVQGMTRRFMMLMGSEGHPTPMDWMLDTRTYGKAIQSTTAAKGTVTWVGETILYQQIRLGMDKVHGMVLGLAAETRRLLVQDLLMLEVDAEGEAVGLPAID